MLAAERKHIIWLCRVNEGIGAPSVELRVEGLPGGVAEIHAGGVAEQDRPVKPEAIKGISEFADRRIDVGQRQHCERGKVRRIDTHDRRQRLVGGAGELIG